MKPRSVLLERKYVPMKKRRLLAGLMSLAVVASLGSCERKHDMNSDASSGLVSVDDTDSSSESNHLTD